MTDTAFWKQLDTQSDEAAVRIAIASNHYSPDTIGIAQEWLRRREEARSSASAAKRDSREEETLSVAKDANTIALAAAVSAADANDIARSARKIALIAAIAAIVAAIAAIKWR